MAFASYSRNGSSSDGLPPPPPAPPLVDLPVSDRFFSIVQYKTEHWIPVPEFQSQIDTFLSSDRSPRVLSVVGPAGCGKTTLAAALVTQRAQLNITHWHFCRWDDPSTTNAPFWMGSKGFEGWIEAQSPPPPPPSSFTGSSTSQSSTPSQPEPVVLVIDALDEASPKYASSIISAVHSGAIPPSVTLIITSRNHLSRNVYGRYQELIMDREPILPIMAKWLKQTQPTLPQELSFWLLQKAGMCWTWLVTVLSEPPDVLEHLKKNKELLVASQVALYAVRARRIWPQPPNWEADHRALSLVVAAYPNPLESWMGWDSNSPTAERLSLFLNEDEVLFHQSFVDWLVEDGMFALPADPTLGHRQLALACFENWKEHDNATLMVTLAVVKCQDPEITRRFCRDVLCDWEWLLKRSSLDSWAGLVDELLQIGSVATVVGKIIREWYMSGSAAVADGLAMFLPPADPAEHNLDSLANTLSKIRANPLGPATSWRPVVDLVFRAPSGIKDVVTFRDNTIPLTLAAGTDGSMILWRVSDHKFLARWDKPPGGHPITSMDVLDEGSGDLVVASSASRAVHIWNVWDGDATTTVLSMHTDAVTSVLVINSSTIVSTGRDSVVIVWRKAPGSKHEWTGEHALFGHERDVYCSTAMGGSKVASGGRDRTIRIWDVDLGRCLAVMVSHNAQLNGIQGLAALESGSIISVGMDTTVQLWPASYRGQPEVLLGHKAPVSCVAVLQDRSKFATGCLNGSIRIWDGSGSCIGLLEGGHDRAVNSLVRTVDRRLISAGADASLVLWDAEGAPLLDPQLHLQAITSCSLLPSHPDLVLTGSQDRTIRVWRLPSAHTPPVVLSVLEGHSGHVAAICALPNHPGSFLTASNDGLVLRWVPAPGSGEGGAPLTWVQDHSRRLSHRHGVNSMLVLDDGETIVVGTQGSEILVWRIDSSKPRWSFPDWHTRGVLCMAALDERRVVSSDGAGRLVVFDALAGAREISFNATGQTAGVPLVVPVSPTQFLTWSAQLVLWDVSVDPATPIWVSTADNVKHLVRVAGGRWLSSGYSENVISLWESLSEEPLEPPVNMLNVKQQIVGLLWDPTLERLVVVGVDNWIGAYTHLPL